MKGRLILALIFFIIAGVFTISGVIYAPLTPEYFDPENIYAIIVPIFIGIAAICYIVALGCIRWWYISR